MFVEIIPEINKRKDKNPHQKSEYSVNSWYTRQDSNLRPLGSKPSTLIR